MRKSGHAVLSIGIVSLFILSFTYQNESVPADIVSPASTTEEVKWLSWEEASALADDKEKKFVVDIYTDWCGWCKKMDANTFQEPHIAKYINENYHAVKFNAEQKQELTYKGKTLKFINKGRRGYHELAAELTLGRLGYPTIVFLDEDMNVIQAINGYKGPDDFEKIMTYFAEDFHKKMPWDKYQRSYTPLKKDSPVKADGN
jgi:thioredoxin-related protein